MYQYLKDPEAIYAKSFATVREEADLNRFPADVAEVVVRLVHACGVPAIANDIAFSDDAVSAGRAAIYSGAPILVDARMVGEGIIRRHLKRNEVICTLNEDGVAEEAKAGVTTRSAIAVQRWAPHLGGSVVCIGNAPTALFRLLELLADGAPNPAVILGFPVGFVGAAESKDALIADNLGIPYITLRGRMGGSAIASASVNALAAGLG